MDSRERFEAKFTQARVLGLTARGVYTCFRHSAWQERCAAETNLLWEGWQAGTAASAAAVPVVELPEDHLFGTPYDYQQELIKRLDEAGIKWK